MAENNDNPLKVFVDTNVFVSAMCGSRSCLLFLHYVENSFQLILCTAVINEFFDVIRRKFPYKLNDADRFLAKLDFQLIETPASKKLEQYREHVPYISDENDFDILVSGWLAKPDVLVSGDLKHFHTDEIRNYFKVMTPSTFLKTYV